MSRRIAGWIGGVLALAGLGSPCWAGEMEAIQVFEGLSQRRDAESRGEYLRANAGTKVEGAGSVEGLFLRTYYDTSVPDSNPAVALIHVSPGRKVACGLPSHLSREESDSFGEGTPVRFRGDLVDAQDWGEWSTLYLGNCSLRPR